MLLERMEDLLLDQLRDLYSAETQIEVGLPLMAECTARPALRQALSELFEQTEMQIVRLDRVFEILEEPARGSRCLGMAGLLQEMEDTLRRGRRGAVLDAAAIACVQRMVGYELAAYTSAIGYARVLGRTDLLELLSLSLHEQRRSGARLGRLEELEIFFTSAALAQSVA